MKWLFRLAVLLPLFGFFLATAPGNRSDADMAFDYAWRVENGIGRLDPQAPLYVPLMRAVYIPLRGLGLAGRAYPLMTTLGALWAAVSVYLFFLFCYHRFSLRPLSSLFATGFFLFTHGVWRYAAEAEPAVPAGALALGAFLLVSREDRRPVEAIAAGLMAGLAVLIQVLSLVPALVMIPAYLKLSGAGGGHARRYLLALGGFLACTIPLLHFGANYAPHELLWAPQVPLLPLSNLFARAFVGMSQCVVSGIALLRFQPVQDLLQGLFPFRMLEEELFMARRLPLAQAVGAVITLYSVLFFMVYAVIRASRALRHRGRIRSGTVPGGRTVLLGVAIWLVIHALFTLGGQPGKPESWLMAMVPLWLLFCGLIVSPLARANKLWIILVLLFFFGLHNWVAGLQIVRDPRGDYNRRKAEAVLALAGPDDAILTAETRVFYRYLRYWSSARILDANAMDPDLADRLPEWPGTVYVLHDIFNPPAPLAVRHPESVERVREIAERLRPQLKRVADDPFGGVYRLRVEAEEVNGEL